MNPDSTELIPEDLLILGSVPAFPDSESLQQIDNLIPLINNWE